MWLNLFFIWTYQYHLRSALTIWDCSGPIPVIVSNFIYVFHTNSMFLTEFQHKSILHLERNLFCIFVESNQSVGYHIFSWGAICFVFGSNKFVKLSYVLVVENWNAIRNDSRRRKYILKMFPILQTLFFIYNFLGFIFYNEIDWILNVCTLNDVVGVDSSINHCFFCLKIARGSIFFKLCDEQLFAIL